VVRADIAALGVGTDPSQPFVPFVHSGVEPELAARLDSPSPRWPQGAPFLGVALRRQHETVGFLYLARKHGGPRFTEQDARAIELLAAFTASAMQSSRLHAALHDEVLAREDLLSMVSHDLRTPLSAMSMAAVLLARSVGDDTRARKHVEIISRNAFRMSRLIADLLTAAKLHEGKLTIEPKAQEVTPLIAAVVEQLAGTATKSGIELSTDIAPNLPPIHCDAERILQVLSNLIGNAVKFTRRGGSIVIAARLGEPPERYVHISVKDTGVGISADALPHVFDRYWQKKEDAARGTGLGLFISKGIVESHHGRITVTSRVGEGSTFEIMLPAVDWIADGESARIV
jgi:signal transduction histidine kinase